MDQLLIALVDHGGLTGLLIAAFALWAYVVWYFGNKILREIKAMSIKLSGINFYLSNRVTKIESHLESHSEHNFHPYRNGENDR